MKITAPRRPTHCGRPTPQLTLSRRPRGRRERTRSALLSGRLGGRWTLTADGRLTYTWSLQRPTRFLSTPSEEAMADQDEGRSPGPRTPPRRTLMA
jgi:hypothetical protein